MLIERACVFWHKIKVQQSRKIRKKNSKKENKRKQEKNAERKKKSARKHGNVSSKSGFTKR